MIILSFPNLLFTVMKKFKFFVLFLLLIPLNLLYSQVKFSAGPEVGYTGPTGDLSGTTMDYYNGTKYGMTGGINLGAIFKVKLTALNLKFGFNYTSMSNSGNAEPTKGYIDLKNSILIISAGPEYAFNIPGSPVKPYIGVDLLFTSFSSDMTFTDDVRKVPNGTYSMSSATRTGLGIGGGVNFGLSKKYSLDLGLRLNFHNLMGKSFSGGDNRIYSYTSLNDDKDPLFDGESDKHPIGNSRSISSIQINLAFLFDF
jgi:opacity protein-like surface antigen